MYSVISIDLYFFHSHKAENAYRSTSLRYMFLLESDTWGDCGLILFYRTYYAHGIIDVVWVYYNATQMVAQIVQYNPETAQPEDPMTASKWADLLVGRERVNSGLLGLPCHPHSRFAF